MRLDRIPDFEGCGIYAIYYAGPFKLYEPISSDGFKMPIYVGKADPEGGRKGIDVQSAWEGKKLNQRIRQHGRKISATTALEIEDFYARYLPADDLFTPIAERLMIAGFQPVWNVILEGFGVNPQGSGRETKQLRPKWHELHRGVPWAERMPPNSVSAISLAEAVKEHLVAHSEPDPALALPGQTLLTDDQLDSNPDLDDSDQLWLQGELES